MKPADEIEKLVKEMSFGAGSEMDSDLRAATARARGQSERTTLAPSRMSTRRLIMKNPIIKLAVAVFVVAVVLGLVSLINSDSTSGVVWADVVAKVQASRGVIFRKIEHIVPDTYGRGADFDMNYYSSMKSRVDGYKGGEINKTIYSDCNTKTVALVDNYHKSYVKVVGEKSMPDSFRMADPTNTVQRFLSRKHKKLGQKTIN